MNRVAVLGAGPMGLAAAYHLAKAGAEVVVLEADDRPGGMSASFDFDGVNIERYYHFVNLPDKHLFALLAELGMEGDLRWQPTKMGFFRPDAKGVGRLHPWGNPLALLKMADVSLTTRLRYGLHAFSCKYLRDLTPLDDIPAADWIRRWEGDEGYDKLWRFLFEKKFFELAEPLSAAWIASRVRRVANSRSSVMTERLGYLEGGSQSLVERLVRAIEALGGRLRLACPARRVLVEAGRVAGVAFDGGVEKVSAVVSTIPLPYLPGLAPDLPAGYAASLRALINVGCACALFRLGRPLTENFWLNTDMPGWDVPGVIEYSNLRPMAESFVYLPFYMPPSHPNWRADDGALLAKARGYLAAINPAAAASEQGARLFRYQHAQPVCPPGFRRMLPPHATGVAGFWAADTSHSFPEDRSINESARIGKELANQALAEG